MDYKEKSSFVKWLDNVWYHYKTHIVIGAFALVIVVVGMTQMLTRKDHDAFFYCVGQYGLTAEANEKFVTQLSETFYVDSTGDGECVVDLKVDKFEMVEDEEGFRFIEDPSEQMTPSERFTLELTVGECIIYIMEPAFFYANLDYLGSFEEEFGYVPEKAIHGKGIVLSDLDFFWAKPYEDDVPRELKQTSTLGYFPDDYIICLANREDRYKKAYYDGNVEFLKKIVEFKHTENN